VTNVFDFKAYKDRRNPPPAAAPPQDPFEQPPWMTVKMFDGADGPVRLIGNFLSVERLRDGARRLIAMARALLAQAYLGDQNNHALPRMVVTLYHSGKVEAECMNGRGPEGQFTEQDWEWVRGSLPHIPMALAAAQAAQQEREQGS
jgi:hypothetical protein